MKYIFKQIDNISGRCAETTVEFSADALSDVLEHFEMFLRGCGYHPSGVLDFVEDTFEPDEQVHEWTQTLRDDAEWPFAKEKQPESIYEGDLNSPSAGASDKWTSPWQGTAPSVAMQWTAEQLTKEKSVCPICKIDNETMAQHECWDDNCPKGKDAD
jgi:hypothetical protein